MRLLYFHNYDTTQLYNKLQLYFCLRKNLVIQLLFRNIIYNLIIYNTGMQHITQDTSLIEIFSTQSIKKTLTVSE